MIKLNTLFLNLLKPKRSKCALVMICHNLIHNFTLNFESQSTNTLNPNHQIPQFSNQNLTQITTTHMSNCTNLLQLNQMYAHIIKTHILELAQNAFHWNNIIRSYLRLDYPYMALRVYVLMTRAGVSPDSYTLPIVLKAVTLDFAVKWVWKIHSVAIVNGLESNEFCESGLISLYGKAGELDNARKVFDQNPDRNLGSWNAIIGSFARGGHAKEAIDMFLELQKCGLEPDDVTMVSVVSACGSYGDLDFALQLHKCVIQAETNGKSDMLMLSSLVDMYGKCGRMDLANRVFARMRQRSVSTWTSLIMGYAAHGHVKEALECFRCMREEGVRPNYVTFVAVLTACVHGGLVEKGRLYFDMMEKGYGIIPKMQHFGAMVDLLGRAGLLDEAREMVEGMPMDANVVIWGCLLGACEKHGNVKMGEWVAKHLQELEPWNSGIYVVLSNIYAGACMWEDAQRIRQVMKEKKVGKSPGYSSTSNS